MPQIRRLQFNQQLNPRRFVAAAIGIVLTVQIGLSIGVRAQESLDPRGSETEQISKQRQRLLSIPSDELKPTLLELARRLRGDRHGDDESSVVQAMNVIVHEHPGFDTSLAALVDEALLDDGHTTAINNPIAIRVRLSAAAKAGHLTDKRIAETIAQAALRSRTGSQRIAYAAGLAAAMLEFEKPAAPTQLMQLLRSDLGAIKLVAVDWFHARPLNTVKSRKEFLREALRSEPLQVRERTLSHLLGLTKSDLEVLRDIIPSDCEREPASAVKSLCRQVAEKLKTKKVGAR